MKRIAWWFKVNEYRFGGLHYILAAIGLFIIVLSLIFAPLIMAGAARAQVTRDSLTAGPASTASSGDVAAAVATATLAAPTGSGISPAATWYVTGFEITGTGATTAVGIPCTMTGLLGATATWDFAVASGATVGNSVTYNFPGGLAGNPGTAIVLSCPSFGSGNVHAAVTLHGILSR